MKGHLLFVAPSAYSLGGVPRWLDVLLPGLERRGWECTLALTAGSHHDAADYMRHHPWHRSVMLSNPSGSRLGRAEAIAKAAAQVRPDAIVATNIASAYDSQRLMLARGSAPRLLLALHGLQADQFADLAQHRDVIDAAVCVNRLAQALAERSLGDTGRVFYAPAGVEPCAARAPQRTTGAIRLVHAGRIEQHQKRVLDLPALGSELRRRGIAFTFTVVGDGPDLARLRGEVERLALQDQFSFTGALPAEDTRRKIASHDALLIPSQWETGPLVAWEAFSCGVPVIASRFIGSGLEGALRDRETALLHGIGDIAAAADCVEALTDDALRERIRANASALYAKRYTGEASTAAWDRALAAAIRAPRREGPRTPLQLDASGRLDRWFGAPAAERLRRVLGVSFGHASAGGEWPHTDNPGADARAFDTLAATLDAGHVIQAAIEEPA
jgi:glycosyltransferase involved in cell wall biosynthesis